MWIVLIVALLVALTLVQSVGIEAAAALVLFALAGIVGWRVFRKAAPAVSLPPFAPPEHYCLRCGATLPASARSCKDCGSASWSVRD